MIIGVAKSAMVLLQLASLTPGVDAGGLPECQHESTWHSGFGRCFTYDQDYDPPLVWEYDWYYCYYYDYYDYCHYYYLSYYEYYDNNYAYCDEDDDDSGLIAEDACPQCGSCVSALPTCQHEYTFNGGWGPCFTYDQHYESWTLEYDWYYCAYYDYYDYCYYYYRYYFEYYYNHYYCDRHADGSLSGLSAEDACPQCGSCLQSCVETPGGWHDSNWNDCNDYFYNNWCTASGGTGSGWSYGAFSDYALFGVSADQACCQCGGGFGWGPTPAPTPAPTEEHHYSQRLNTGCSVTRGDHNGAGLALAEAQRSCSSDPNCGGVWDYLCDDSGYTICDISSQYTIGSNGCLHQKISGPAPTYAPTDTPTSAPTSAPTDTTETSTSSDVTSSETSSRTSTTDTTITRTATSSSTESTSTRTATSSSAHTTTVTSNTAIWARRVSGGVSLSVADAEAYSEDVRVKESWAIYFAETVSVSYDRCSVVLTQVGRRLTDSMRSAGNVEVTYEITVPTDRADAVKADIEAVNASQLTSGILGVMMDQGVAAAMTNWTVEFLEQPSIEQVTLTSTRTTTSTATTTSAPAAERLVTTQDPDVDSTTSASRVRIDGAIDGVIGGDINGTLGFELESDAAVPVAAGKFAALPIFVALRALL